jgi:nucleoside phosphorylase/CheY-like chemotaxis protein
MKVLIVEDLKAKANAVASAVEEAGVAGEDIRIIPDIREAKRTLTESSVGLLILDLRIPARFDKSPALSGGEDLLEWIERDDDVHKPTVTIALSAAVVSDAMQRALAGRGVIFITYEQSNSTWREFLVAFVRRLRGAPLGALVPPPPVTEKAVPVVVLTAVDIELLQARRAFSCGADPEIRREQSWYHGEIRDGDLHIPLVVAQAPQMGMPAAATLCAQAHRAWGPRLVIMVGVCAGIRGEVGFGDLVVADPVWDYNSGKLDSSGYLHADPRPIHLKSSVRSVVDALGENSEIERACKDWPAQRPDRICQLARRPAVSGASVVKDPRVSELVREQGRKVAAIDMEAYGVYYAAEHLSRDLDFLSVKAVVDHADDEKSDQFQLFGAYLSASFARIFILRWYREKEKVRRGEGAGAR